jgi:hypothetical protein
MSTLKSGGDGQACAGDDVIDMHSFGVWNVAGADDRTDDHPADIRPLITRHRLRRRRRRTAATLLAGASIALGAAATRSSGASGASAHAPSATPVTRVTHHPASSVQQPPTSATCIASPTARTTQAPAAPTPNGTGFARLRPSASVSGNPDPEATGTSTAAAATAAAPAIPEGQASEDPPISD